MTTLLLDADVIAFKIAAVNEEAIDWDGDGDLHVISDEGAARSHCVQYVEEIQEFLEADEVIVCLSDPSARYYRHDFFPEYKANRTHGRKPELVSPMKKFLRENWRSYEKPNLEADDVMGILATHPDLIEGERIIVTTDKDLRQIPGYHYNFKTLEVDEESEEAGEYFFYTQVLTGDTVDGFKGCPGIGPKKAEKILGDLEADEYWQAIVEAYESKGLTEQDALTQARVARILRHGEYDYKNKEPILWKP